MSEISTWCRLGECAAGLSATVSDGRITKISVDPEHALGRHDACGLCTGSAGAATDPRRLLRPRRRNAGAWEEIGWEEAIKEVAGAIRSHRAATATWAGAPVGLNAAGTARTVAFQLALGAPYLFSPLSTMGGPWLRAAELVLGHPVVLHGDVGRAHYVLLLGANQEAQGWGPMQLGRNHAADLAFSRKTKGTKVIAVDPRRTPVAAAADGHVAIRPGTELFFVLGMIDQILKGGWHEEQYVQDYTRGLDELRAALAAWPTERCAAACGVAPEDIGGAALKFSRAAMAVAHRSPQALQSEHGTLTAWALLVLHALTANLLRPGGLFEARGTPDAHPVATQLPTDKAPQVGGLPLLLLQGPGLALVDEIRAGRVKVLLSLHGDPVRDVPGLREVVDQLDLLVALDLAENETTRRAHLVLPGTHAWERADVHLHDAAILPVRHNQWSPALVAPPGEARDEAEVLREIFAAVGPSLRKGAFGLHLQALGTVLARAELGPWLEKAVTLSGKVERAALDGRGWYGGEVNRAEWRLSTPSERIELLPPAVAEALGRLRDPDTGSLFLLSSAARDMAIRPFDRPDLDPGVGLHPSLGFEEGARVRVATSAGEVEATVHLDPGLRPDCVDLPAGYAVDVAALLPPDRRDPFTGTPACNGLPCTVRRA